MFSFCFKNHKRHKNINIPPNLKIICVEWARSCFSNCVQGCLYIMAKIKPSCDYSNSSSDESDNPMQVCLLIICIFVKFIHINFFYLWLTCKGWERKDGVEYRWSPHNTHSSNIIGFTSIICTVSGAVDASNTNVSSPGSIVRININFTNSFLEWK